MSKYGLVSGPYFPLFGLNTTIYSVIWRFTIWTLFTQCFCIIIYSFVCQYSLHYYWYCYNQKQSSGAVLQKKVLFQISQNPQENTKKEILAQMFSCKFCKISHNIFFKEHFGRLLHHKLSLFLLSHLYSKTMSHMFSDWIFFRFNL